jgi:putative ABC transport system permease protein
MIPIQPILIALRRHKAGTLLIALQIALTLAVVCNALFVIHARIERVSRDTGIVEHELILVNNHWVGNLADVPVRQATDLATIRALPGVEDAIATNAVPLVGSGWRSGVRAAPGARNTFDAAMYFVDTHALTTYGLRLVEGRNFRDDEIGTLDDNGSPDAPTAIITRDMALKIFPDGGALGKQIYLGTTNARPTTIIGIVERLQSPQTEAGSDAGWQDVALIPLRRIDAGAFFLVRARPGQRDALLRSVPAALKGVSNRRVIPQPHGVMTFDALRELAYRSDRGLAWMMGGISLVLLLVTAAGIVGLTSFWVGQRRRQIGVRRALGATRGDILNYFLAENILISLGGVIVGTVLAYLLNRWMMVSFETSRLALGYVASGAVLLLVLGQLAVLAPAMRASRVSPVEATRSG